LEIPQANFRPERLLNEADDTTESQLTGDAEGWPPAEEKGCQHALSGERERLTGNDADEIGRGTAKSQQRRF
jgi:hypothetical protein